MMDNGSIDLQSYSSLATALLSSALKLSHAFKFKKQFLLNHTLFLWAFIAVEQIF